MPAPIALQLYTVREAIARDYEGVVRKVADIGYAGVETAGFPGTTPEAAGKLFRELGLAVPSAHGPMPVGDKTNEVVDMMHAIGSTRIVSGLDRTGSPMPTRFARRPTSSTRPPRPRSNTASPSASTTTGGSSRSFPTAGLRLMCSWSG